MHSRDALTTAVLVAPRTLREKELADNYEAGRQLAPLLLTMLVVLAAGIVGLALVVVRVRRRRAEMRKIAEE